MKTAEIKVSKWDARRAYEGYRAALEKDRSHEPAEVQERLRAEDDAARKVYLELSRGRSLIDLRKTMFETGLKDDGYPKLAIARADMQKVYVDRDFRHLYFWCGDKHPLFNSRVARDKSIKFRTDGFPKLPSQGRFSQASAIVPLIPPNLRPSKSLASYHILFEAEWSITPPVDPILLKWIAGDVWAVLAQWDLTEVERAVLGMRADAR